MLILTGEAAAGIGLAAGMAGSGGALAAAGTEIMGNVSAAPEKAHAVNLPQMTLQPVSPSAPGASAPTCPRETRGPKAGFTDPPMSNFPEFFRLFGPPSLMFLC
jgi:hypothetical protein